MKTGQTNVLHAVLSVYLCRLSIRFCREQYGGHPFLCTSDLGVSNYVVTQPPKVGINNRALDVKAGAPVRFVASTKPTPGPGVKSNLSWTLSLLSLCFGSFPWARFWVRSQEEWFEFRSHTQTVSHNNVFQSCCITGVRGNHIQMLLFSKESQHNCLRQHFLLLVNW